MMCEELEKLEAQNIAIHTRARQLDLSDEEREKLQGELIVMVFKINAHQAFGHGGEPCPGE